MLIRALFPEHQEARTTSNLGVFVFTPCALTPFFAVRTTPVFASLWRHFPDCLEINSAGHALLMSTNAASKVPCTVERLLAPSHAFSGWSSYPFLNTNVPSTLCAFYPYEDFTQMQPRRVSVSLYQTSLPRCSRCRALLSLGVSCLLLLTSCQRASGIHICPALFLCQSRLGQQRVRVHCLIPHNLRLIVLRRYTASLIDVGACSSTSQTCATFVLFLLYSHCTHVMSSSCAPTSERATVSNTVQFSINLSKKPGWQLSFKSQAPSGPGIVWLIATTTPSMHPASNNVSFDTGQVAFLSTQRLAGARTQRTPNPSPAPPQSTVFFRRPNVRSSKYADSRQGDV